MTIKTERWLELKTHPRRKRSDTNPATLGANYPGAAQYVQKASRHQLHFRPHELDGQ